MTRELPLTKGYVALVDEDDYERAARFHWRASIRHTQSGVRIDALRTVNKGGRKTTTQYLSRFLMNAQPGQEVDHQNGLPLDCRRRGNLRFATTFQNKANRRKPISGSTPFKGVRLEMTGKWIARICRMGTRIHLGTFPTAKEAAIAYDKASREFDGEFACVNFPRAGERKA